jgi:hypothetical protein
MSKVKGALPGRTAASSPKTARQQEYSTKRRGELSELAFVYKAASLGFGVAKPYGDSERYDFVLDSRIEVEPREERASQEPEEKWAERDFPHKLWRIQVKATTQLLNGQYRINAHRRIYCRAVAYHPSEVDFLVAHIIPEDSWFILPIRAAEGRTSLFFSPRNFPRLGLYDAYREAWHLFRQPP